MASFRWHPDERHPQIEPHSKAKLEVLRTYDPMLDFHRGSLHLGPKFSGNLSAQCFAMRNVARIATRYDRYCAHIFLSAALLVAMLVF